MKFRIYYIFIFILLCLLVFIIYKLFGDKVFLKLKRLPRRKYIILRNIMIIVDNVSYHIDYVVVSDYGIFVIESRKGSGLVLGNQYDNDWIQCYGLKKYFFENPIRINNGNIKALSSILGIDIGKFVSIICLSDKVKLSVTSRTDVVKLEYLLGIISKYKDISIENKKDIAKDIKILNVKSKKIRKNHINKIRNQANRMSDLVCPKCGHKLITRNGKYGKFYGCSEYPKCKYTHKID